MDERPDYDLQAMSTEELHALHAVLTARVAAHRCQRRTVLALFLANILLFACAVVGGIRGAWWARWSFEAALGAQCGQVFYVLQALWRRDVHQ